MNVQHLVCLWVLGSLLVGCSDTGDPAVSDTRDTIDATGDGVVDDTAVSDSVATSDTGEDASADTVPAETAPDDTGVADSQTAEVSDTASPPTCPETLAMVAGVTVVKDGQYHTIQALGGDNVGPRDITVRLPASYDSVAAAAERYPVLYAHDGQNLFFASLSAFGEWGLDEALESSLTAATIERPVIVVGVHNTSNRIGDYTPTADPDYGGGNAAAYGAYLVDVVKPAIDRLYRTRCGRADTATMGSSLGGLVSLYLGLEHPDVFGRVAAVSPSFWWDNQALLTAFDGYSGALPDRLWIDMGTREGQTTGDLTSSVATVRRARDRAMDRGASLGLGLGYLEAPGGGHNESSWRARLPAILAYLFGPEPSAQSQPETLAIGFFKNPLSVGESTNMWVNASFSDARRLTVPNADAGLVWADGAATLDASGHIEAAAPGETAVTATYRSVSTTATVSVGGGGAVTAVTFEVEVPTTTPGADTVYVTGDLPVLSGWDAAGVAMTAVGGDRWSVTLQIVDGQHFEYKYTRGSWPKVEVAASGDDIGNRTSAASGESMTLQDTVQAWHDGAP